MSEATFSKLLDQMAEITMSSTALIEFLNELAEQMGSQMQLCCSRTLGNLPTLPRRDNEGKRA